ncbi:unnamed protein product [Protopolystoma xenopodis]|uniref:Uncharacterized protein n=1 Tax=Protopolystoma xenopodis TaxID=117903 RepID=A0A3S5BQG1_9PLAT|nr:unnamed protein product [Protopolystoma xenopodis]
MSSSSDNVHHVMDEILARFYPKLERMTRGLRQHERRIQAKWLQNNSNLPSFSGETNQRISSSYTSIPNGIVMEVSGVLRLWENSAQSFITRSAQVLHKKRIYHLRPDP